MLKQILSLAILFPAALAAQNSKLDSFMREQMKKQGIPGASVVVLKNGKVLASRSYGLSNIELAVPVTSKTVFPVASITKTFTGTAVMTLVEQGRLSLDDKVRTLLPELPESWNRVTVRQLLGHTSGLPDVIVNPVTGTWLGDTRADALRKLAEMPLQGAPGDAWSYNQTNYMLLGMIVEKISGSTFDDFIIQRIARPLGLGSVSYGDSRVIVPNRGSWYSMIEWSEGRPKRAKAAYPAWITYPSFIHTAAGLNMTALDLARFAEAVAHGRIIRPATLEQMWSAVRLNDGTTFRMEKTLGVGLGWLVDDVPEHRAVGGTGGSAVAFRHYRNDDLTIVVMTNLQGIDPDAMTDSIAAFYIPALASRN